MSDNAPFSVIVTEGIHDVMAISKILEIKGFQEARDIERIPDFLKNIIPKTYPFEGSELSRRVPYPSFFFYEDHWILVSNAGGEGKLVDNLKGILSIPFKDDIVSMLRSVAILADADRKTASQERDEIYRQLFEAFQEEDDFAFDCSAPANVILYGKEKPFGVYIFPNNQEEGTLERILLDGAQEEYPELFTKAQEYVIYAKGFPYGQVLTKNFNSDKAAVGVIASVLRPGRAVQASIRDDNWFTADNLSKLPLHRGLFEFIDLAIIGHLKDGQPCPASTA